MTDERISARSAFFDDEEEEEETSVRAHMILAYGYGGVATAGKKLIKRAQGRKANDAADARELMPVLSMGG